MAKFERAEVEEAFKNYFHVGVIGEDWVAWSQLFTEDAWYKDHYWGTFHGPKEIEMFLEGTMGYAAHVYTPLIWYSIDGVDGDRVVWKGLNRADNPDPDGEPFGFESMQILHYAGDGKWKSEEDWWIAYESKKFAIEYQAACDRAGDPDFRKKMSRKDWGTWVDWAHPADDHVVSPSWLGKDIAPIDTLSDISFGVRNPKTKR